MTLLFLAGELYLKPEPNKKLIVKETSDGGLIITTQ